MADKTTINLDDKSIYPKYDPDNMLQHLHLFPELCERAWNMALDFRLPEDYSKVNKIVVLGMGGSAIGGDLLSSLAFAESKILVLLCRDYTLPEYVDAGTLVIASSYSGMTEETLSAFEQAIETPAKKLAITTGGKLKALCESKGIPALTFDYKAQPRAALPFSFFILLGIFQNLRILKNKTRQVTGTISALSNLNAKISENVPLVQNQAKQIAQKLFGNLVLIYGAGITAEAAHRWKTQINENSKTMAFYEVFPELNHNAIVGYGLPGQITQNTKVVILDSDFLHERVRLRIQITQNLLKQAGIEYLVLKGEGKSGLSQMLEMVLLGDYVSYYLAMLNQVDPSPVKSIAFLKGNLAER